VAEIIPIIERLGSLGILALMVWRAPAIIAAIQGLLNGVIDKIGAIQDKSLDIYVKQQEAERTMVSQRFETMERSLEKISEVLDSSMKAQNEVLHQLSEVRHRLGVLEKT
jgi:hypothetical protein